jgi:hypothetical protein
MAPSGGARQESRRSLTWAQSDVGKREPTVGQGQLPELPPGALFAVREAVDDVHHGLAFTPRVKSDGGRRASP